MRRSYWPAEPLRPGNSLRLKAQAMVCNRGRIEHVANPPTILPLGDSAEPVGAFHDSANLNLAKRRLCAALGIRLGSSEHCCAISVARVRAALTASIPRSNRPLARRTNLGAAKAAPSSSFS
jgi:hypothetical protein